MKYTKLSKDAYNLHFIYTNRFKKTRIKINFKEKLDEEKIVYRNMLSLVLMEATKKFNSRRLLEIECENLYDIDVGSGTNILGNYNILSFYTAFINEKYTEPKMTEKSLEFFLDFIFNPDIKDNKFNEDTFNVAKNKLHIDIEKFGDNPGRLADYNFRKLVAPNTPASIRAVGELKDLDSVTRSNLYEYYKYLINNDLIDIFVIGNINVLKLEKLLDKYFKNKSIRENSSHILVHKDKTALVTKKDTKNINQSILYMGGKVFDLTDFERWYVLPIYNEILGGGPASKLFSEVREKNSLCYYATSYFMGVSSIEVITSSIDSKNYDKVVELINIEIDKMKKGEFTLEDIKKAIISNTAFLEEMEDSPDSIMRMYQNYEYLHLDLKDRRIKLFNKVTKEDIVRVASKIEIDTIYLLEGSKRDEKND